MRLLEEAGEGSEGRPREAAGVCERDAELILGHIRNVRLLAASSRTHVQMRTKILGTRNQ